jgi:hypothetical protein
MPGVFGDVFRQAELMAEAGKGSDTLAHNHERYPERKDSLQGQL